MNRPVRLTPADRAEIGRTVGSPGSSWNERNMSQTAFEKEAKIGFSIIEPFANPAYEKEIETRVQADYEQEKAEIARSSQAATAAIDHSAVLHNDPPALAQEAGMSLEERIPAQNSRMNEQEGATGRGMER